MSTETESKPSVEPAPEACKCLEVIKANLIKKFGESADVELELKPTIDPETFEMGTDLPPMYFNYLIGKGRRRKQSYVKFAFCPFCGKRK